MKKKQLSTLITALCLLAAFVLWTLAVRTLDLGAIGPNGSTVGLSSINGPVHDALGVNMTLYTITDWLGLVPFAFALGFAILGLFQLIAKKSIKKVDRSILVLGVFYIAVGAAYLLFEKVVINYRPVLIEGILEASYPSSTTMLSLCVMPTAIMQLWGRIKNRPLRLTVTCIIAAFTAFMVIGRLISGVHWLTDIIGGALLSSALVTLYAFACGAVSES